LKVIGVYQNSFTPLESKCLTCNKKVFPRPDKVKSSGYRCGHCSGRANPAKKAEEVVRKMGHTPLEPYKSALAPWKMKCGGCGKTITPKYNSIQQGNWGCGFCGHARSASKKKELHSKEAFRMMRDAFCEPLVPYPGNNVPWKSRCMKCDSLIQPRLGGIQSGQGGCEKCGIAKRAKTSMLSEKEAISRLKKLKLKPLESYPGTAKPWKCECLRCGSVVRPRLNYLERSVYGCAVCAGKIVDVKSAISLMRKAKLIPQIKFPGSDKPWLCICQKCKREVAPRYSSIKAGQGGCKWCKGPSASVDPTVAVQTLLALDIQPLEPFKTSHAKWKSRCLRCENQINPSYHDIKQGSGGCKYCAPNFVNLSRINEVMKKAGLEPQEEYPGSKASWKVKHTECGRIFKVEYANVRKSSSCRYCAGKAVVPKEAIASMKMSGLQPLLPYPGSKKPWKCRCNVCKRIVYSSYEVIVNRNGGCVYCTGHKVDSKDAKNLMLLNGLKPLEPFPGSKKKWKCRCETCKRIVSPMYASIKSRQGGCRFCADWGIDYGASGYIYLMTHQELSAHKIGIGNSVRSRGRSRIAQHEKRGWKLFKQMDFEVTDDAYFLEQDVLNWLREDKGLSVHLSEFEMPQGGYSETVDATEIELVTIWAKIKDLSKVTR
jgi:recombinational DNA repair protein (RecF pathway)